MSNTPTIESKYQLKTLHAEIDLYDRRLAHLLKFEVFATDAARAAAVRKLTLKRDPLVATARRLAEEGVEFKQSELPRSFRPEGVPAPVEVPEPQAAEPTPTENRNARRHNAGHTAATLDWEKSIQHYMQNKPAKV
ncbi:MAG: hypothetical protein WBY53_05560 [Acidobacteriaceae bacterium]